MTYTLSRIMSAATAGYGVFALAKPDHLGTALKAPKHQMPAMDLLARTYGVRDVAISTAGLVGSPATVRAAMKLRIANDVGDGLLLALSTEQSDVRTKALAVTMSWAALNSLALYLDSRHS